MSADMREDSDVLLVLQVESYAARIRCVCDKLQHVLAFQPRHPDGVRGRIRPVHV